MPLNFKVIGKPILEPITLAQAKAQSRVDQAYTDDDVLFEIYIPAARQLAEKITRRGFFNQTWQRTLDNFPMAASFDMTPSPADRWNWPIAGGMWNRLVIDLPGGPVVGIDSITYLDANGNPATLDPADFVADLNSEPCRVTPPSSTMVWPWTGTYLPGSVAITYEVASFVCAVAEAFTGPAEAPYTYALKKSPQTAVKSVTQLVDGVVTPVTGWTVAAGVLTLPAGAAGLALTANYYIPEFPALLQVALLMLVEHFYRNPGATTDLQLEDLPIGVQSILSPYIVEWSDYRPC
jgi:hypothetical protein